MDVVTAWLKKPYSPDMDVWHWVLFIVLVLIIASGWAHTVSIIKKVA